MLKSLFCLTAFVLSSSAAQAMYLDWSGGYRYEWTEIDKPGLGNSANCGTGLSASASCRKAYGLNYLYLSPQIIAADGVNVVSRFEILQQQTGAYRNAQMGSLWGAGATSSTNNADNNSLLTQQESTSIRVSQLYLNINQEYGAIVVGRAPLHFGLGITQNAGKEIFDHWADVHDMLAYKFVIGNFYMMPIFGRVRDTDFGQGQNMNDEILQMVYDSPESGSTIGFMINNRKADGPTNDTPTDVGGSTGTKSGDLRMQRMNIMIGRVWEPFTFKMEIGSITGDTGILRGTDNVRFNSYGVATEMTFPRPDSKFQWSLRAGIASGDDPNTKDYEAYQFHRNYDVAFMLFNHRLGQADFLTTNAIKDKSLGLSNSADDEAISNVAYISPQVKHIYSDKIEMKHTLTYAQLMANPTAASGMSMGLGLEYDFEATYKYTDKIQWVNQVGYLIPGAAFKNGSSGYENSQTFGFTSKAAISF